MKIRGKQYTRAHRLAPRNCTKASLWRESSLHSALAAFWGRPDTCWRLRLTACKAVALERSAQASSSLFSSSLWAQRLASGTVLAAAWISRLPHTCGHGSDSGGSRVSIPSRSFHFPMSPVTPWHEMEIFFDFIPMLQTHRGPITSKSAAFNLNHPGPSLFVLHDFTVYPNQCTNVIFPLVCNTI